jgi:hypothetical protein
MGENRLNWGIIFPEFCDIFIPPLIYEMDIILNVNFAVTGDHKNVHPKTLEMG